MLRKTETCLFDGPAPIYHRKAMSLVKGAVWRGNYGANGRWANKIGMCETVTGRKSLGELDREFMNYVHTHRIRHDQLAASYNRASPSWKRAKIDNYYFRRRRDQYVSRALCVYLQYETMRTLKEQAKLAKQYGQAAVNMALGDLPDEKKRKSRLATVARRVRAPVMQTVVPKYVPTRGQQITDRFDRKYRLH